MRKLVIFIIVLFVTQSFFMLEEETLIIIASVVWLDAAGSFIKQNLESELENRGDVIKSKFVWYLQAKQGLLKLLITKHEERKKLALELVSIYSLYVDMLLEKSLSNYLWDMLVISRYEVNNDLTARGLLVVKEILIEELEELLVTVNKKDIGSLEWFSSK